MAEKHEGEPTPRRRGSLTDLFFPAAPREGEPTTRRRNVRTSGSTGHKFIILAKSLSRFNISSSNVNAAESVTYSSTRGCPSDESVPFRTAVMRGMAHGRGLFVPDFVPSVSPEELEGWRGLGYAELATEVIALFVQDDEVPRDVLAGIVKRSCAAFRSEDVAPLTKVGGHYVLELFHGPTFAFKDFAFQILGNFLEHFLSHGTNGSRLAVLGAASGDSGPAAIHGLRGKEGVDCIILYPVGRVGEVQERQMTTVPDDNVHCVAIDGTLDDCRDIVEACLADREFWDDVERGAVDGVNWCGVLAQITYYFWSYLRVTDAEKDAKKVNFSVPTGNFGDVLAGYYSKRMGLPVGDLIVATNENNILHRFFVTGKYDRRDVQETISPSMDVCASSNFERYLYHLAGDDPSTLASWVSAFELTGKLFLRGKKLEEARADFRSAKADAADTLETIRRYRDVEGYQLCPHSAAGVNAAYQLDATGSDTVCLATAHFAKYSNPRSEDAAPLPKIPEELSRLQRLETRSNIFPNDAELVRRFVKRRIEERMERRKERDERKKFVNNLLLVSAAVGVATIVVTVLRRR